MSVAWRNTNARIRASVLQYAMGKALSAPLSLITMVLLARLLTAPEYAAYVACLAVVEMSIVIGGLGTEWLMQTATMAIRTQGNAAQAHRGLLLFTALPMLTQGLAGASLYALAPLLSRSLSGVASTEHLQLAALIVAIEGPVRMLRDSFMPILLMQPWSQLCTLVRVLALFVPVLLLWAPPGMSYQAPDGLATDHVLVFELQAASVTLVLVVAVLLHRAWRERPVQAMNASIRPWLGRPAWRFAAHAWLSILMSLAMSTDLLIALVARSLGPEATAAFGFAVRWLEVVRRHLPVDLFWGAARPAVIARYEVSQRDPEVLMRDARRLILANLATVAVALVLAMTIGDGVLAWLSGGQMPVIHGLLACLMLLLITHTLRRVLELVAYLRGHSGRFVLASALALGAPVSVLAALELWPLPQAAVLTAVAVDSLLVAVALALLQRTGDRILPWPADSGGSARTP